MYCLRYLKYPSAKDITNSSPITWGLKAKAMRRHLLFPRGKAASSGISIRRTAFKEWSYFSLSCFQHIIHIRKVISKVVHFTFLFILNSTLTINNSANHFHLFPYLLSFSLILFWCKPEIFYYWKINDKWQSFEDRGLFPICNAPHFCFWKPSWHPAVHKDYMYQDNQ